MKHPITILAVTALLASGLSAQSLVSPPHAVGVEGNSSSGVTFTNPLTRTQQSDGNLVGSSVALLRSLSFRRNSGAQTTATSRKVDLQVDMGYAVATFTRTFDSNYATGTRKTVFTKKNVVLPDWTAAPPVPADFDLTIKFDTPFVNDRTRIPVWDVLCSNNTGGGSYSMDWFSSVPSITKGERPESLGTGCKTKNGTFGLSFETQCDATNLNLLVSLVQGASSSAGLLLLGTKDINANAGLCTNLRADLTFIFAIGATDTTGALNTTLPIPWSTGVAGIPLVVQGACIDTTQPGLPFALTNGVKTSTPYVAPGGTTTAFKIDRVFSSSSQGPTGTLAKTCVPVLWN